MSVLPPKFRSIPALSRLKVYIILHRCFYNGKHSVTIYLLAGSTVKLQDCFHNFCTRLPPNVSSLGCIKAMYSFPSSPLSYRIIVRIAFVYTKVNPKFPLWTNPLKQLPFLTTRFFPVSPRFESPIYAPR